MRNYQGFLGIKHSKRLNKRNPPIQIGANVFGPKSKCIQTFESMYGRICTYHIDMFVLSVLKRFQECDTNLIAKNLSESTCPVVIIETLPDPPDIRIDIRIVSFTRFDHLHQVNSRNRYK